ncbi:MAG: hypothetical protein WC744_03015 [Patescibacteria group bacterium]|jgi:hypothetical protein
MKKWFSYALFVILVVLLIVLNSPINSFFKSIFDAINIYGSLLNACVTLLVGGVAILVYNRQRNDDKKDAANTILLEIQNAERSLKRVKEAFKTQKGTLPEDIFIMQQESWSKYRYLFVKDFERDDWDEITDFYFRCQKYDEAVSYNNSFFRKNEEQVRVNAAKLLANELKLKEDETDYAIKIVLQNKINVFKKYLNDGFIQELGEILYNPVKPINDAHKYIDDLNFNLSQSRVGIKLRQLAGLPA